MRIRVSLSSCLSRDMVHWEEKISMNDEEMSPVLSIFFTIFCENSLKRSVSPVVRVSSRTFSRSRRNVPFRLWCSEGTLSVCFPNSSSVSTASVSSFRRVPHDSRRINVAFSTTASGFRWSPAVFLPRRSPAIFSKSAVIISHTGTCMVVRVQGKSDVSATSSKPVTAISAGTAMPRLSNSSIVPAAIWSLRLIITSGMLSSRRNRASTARFPSSSSKRPRKILFSGTEMPWRASCSSKSFRRLREMLAGASGPVIRANSLYPWVSTR